MAGKKGRSGGAGKLSAEQHRLRGTFRQDRHGVKALSGDGPQARWLVGLDRDARLQGIWYLQYWQPLDRLAFRRLLRAHAAYEQWFRRTRGGPWPGPDEAARREAESRRLRARIAELLPGVGWRRR
jgi:hypothetical protein